jgi:hypothetical protein
MTEAYNEFAQALVEHRDFILYDLISASVGGSGDNSSKLGRNTERGSKKQWKKPAPSVGASSRMLVLSEEVVGVEQEFDDCGAEPAPIVRNLAPEASAKPKKKIARRVIRKSKGPSSWTDLNVIQ